MLSLNEVRLTIKSLNSRQGVFKMQSMIWTETSRLRLKVRLNHWQPLLMEILFHSYIMATALTFSLTKGHKDLI